MNDRHTTHRDRDEHGRAHNARPRDRLGRPLPHGAIGEDPPGPGDDVTLTAPGSLALAQELLDTGWPFRAHEILEATWKLAPDEERALWKGLAQLAVGATHAARGNTVGARRLLLRGRDAIAPFDSPPEDIDVTGLCTWVADSLATLDRVDDAVELSSPRLRRVSR
ncbi:DUF309 domain-containing protein [Williamsia deligens]|uniref:DUF309 domain-containing protein n=1 Tax=Williamsia deligens TaxID=321325 RepID=A0ABW3G328_9NOCA|nr:hypothetical protein [Williamsia deligens]